MYNDPSPLLCLVRDSFEDTGPEKINIDFNWYRGGTDEYIKGNFQLISIDDAPKIKNCDMRRYLGLQTVKESYRGDKFEIARLETNPFEEIKNSIFIGRAAIKLANIDTIFNITDEIFTFDNMQSSKQITFCDIAAGPGGFTQYLQFRHPNSKGYGMTKREPKLDWNTRVLNMEKFKTFYGSDDTGDLYTGWLQFCELVLRENPQGVDLIMGDGGFDLEKGPNINELLRKQEFLSSRLLLVEALVGIMCTKIGGNFVLKCFDTVTDLSAQLIYILSLCFDKITIFKPVSSRPANSERYIICKKRHSEIKHYIDILREAALLYTSDMYIDNMISNTLPADYIKWLTDINNKSIDLQLATAKNILSHMDGKMVKIPQYDTDKFLIIWNLPDKPLSRNNLLRVF